ncbi:L-seryl-tRNA(Sec) selenium transferase [Salipaludibacillus keqinensis]|uniref:L-seryl-tRNA(Sec) selenium transferase n=1 Tax=Salipaludibacillus keqinensis TaxID=2045207 RepID=A0A323TJV3_9BACI|nr:L-seryl-tRNA(Sec) selenium transferase [Salipaludibacillus keqinensis]PYZ95271.1 L-seryl-tRNA(Sec) selenium transferase [Salipaludibacillus keqinensis]
MSLLKKLPPVHEVLDSEELSIIHRTYGVPKSLLKEWTNEELGQLRQQLLNEESTSFRSWSREEYTSFIHKQLQLRAKKYHPYILRRVINGTGTVLHTNLGRARLSERAMNQVIQSSKYYSNLEYNISSGGRGSRHSIIEDLLIKATGAEAAMVVNNNAAAVYLILRALTKGSEVVVSRGELVEIGGSFRVSSIMEESDATLVEVGTTNKTHPYDYEHAITDETKMFMKVHTSNFKTIGFTEEVSVKKLKEIARENKDQAPIIVYEDLGSGSLFPYMNEGIGDEPMVKQSMLNGADLISFSGDKLLGGPQAGIIAGSKELITKLKKHQLARVLRVDKMTLAALETTLFDYVYDRDAMKDIPAIRDIMKTQQEISTQLDQFITRIQKKYDTLSFSKEKDVSKVGGGTMPTEELPTWGFTVEKQRTSANDVEAFLRKGKIPLIGRIKEDRVFIDFRTITEEEMVIMETLLADLDRHK